MALRAGLHDVAPAQRGARVRDRQDVVRPVTVVALRGRLVAEPRHLAVERVEEGLRLIVVAPPALIHHQQAEVTSIGAADGVRGVAVLARGQLAAVAGVADRPRVDAGVERLLDPVVTGAAGTGDVVRMDRRRRVAGRQRRVRRVAARARGGDDQAALEEPLAVDAHLVALDRRGGLDEVEAARVLLRELHQATHYPGLARLLLDPHRRGLALAMAPGAQLGHVAREGGRRGIRPAERGVVIVAVEAHRSIGVPFGCQLPVYASVVLLRLIGMADAAVHRRLDRGARSMQRGAHLGVALRASRAGVPRGVVGLLVHEQGYRVALRDAHQTLVAVTTHAVGVSRTRLVEHPAYPVRRVTVHAGRDSVRLLLPQPALDHLAVHLLDLAVALCAGRGDVVDVDRGARVGVGQDLVRGVAGRAHRRHGEPLAVQSLAMDGLGVVLEDAVLRDVARARYRCSLVVALPAQDRDVHHRRARRRVGVRLHVVCAVAVHAARRQRIGARGCLPVQRLPVLLRLRPVAQCAVDLGYLVGVREGETGVAHHALHARRTVHGGVEHFGPHDQSLRVAAAREHGGVVVAHEAGLIVLRHGGCGQHEQGGGEQRSPPNHPCPMVPAARPPPVLATHPHQPTPP